MNDAEPKIIFYNLDGKKLDNLNIKCNEKLDLTKKIKVSKEFNQALKLVIEKDLNLLSDKLRTTINSIIKTLAKNETILNEKLKDDIESIDDIINDMETIISDLIIKKNNIKIGLFSANKKEKKEKIKKLDNCIKTLLKNQNDIISIKNEYIKLVKRNNGLETLELDEEESDTKKESDPLERTINFYMKKDKRN